MHGRRSYLTDGLLSFNMSIGRMPRQLIQTFVLQTPGDSAGRLLACANSNGPPPHVHENQESLFELLSSRNGKALMYYLQ